MKKINHKILMPIVFSIVMVLVYLLNRETPEVTVKKELKFNERVEIPELNQEIPKEKQGDNDINILSEEEMVKLGLSKSIAAKIVEYREFAGTIENFSELRRVKGVGDKTLEKIKKLLVLKKENIGKKTKLDINRASEDELLMYGFSKKEMEKIFEWKMTKGNIFSNIDLIKLIGERRYDQLKNGINY